jgi:hypothetical protein
VKVDLKVLLLCDYTGNNKENQEEHREKKKLLATLILKK